MKPRSYLLLSSVALTASLPAAAGFLGCGGEDDRAGGAIDASVGEASDLPDSERPPPTPSASAGNVCGRTAGLFAGSSWPLAGGCPTRAGRSELLGPQSGTVKWTVSEPSVGSSPVIGSGGLVWLGTEGGDVLAITSSGAIRSRFSTRAPVRSTAAIDAQGNAVIVGGDGVLYGLRAGLDLPGDEDAGDAGDGSDGGDGGNGGNTIVVFSRPLSSPPSGPLASSPVIGGDGTIYVGTSDGKLVALGAQGTNERWSVVTNDTSGSSPALGQAETVYLASSDGKLYATRPEGTRAWSFDLGAPASGSAAVGGDGTVYVGTSDGKLHAVTPEGVERWAAVAGVALRGTPAVYADRVYVGSEDKKLYAFATRDGAKAWEYETLGVVATPLITLNGNVHVGSSDGRLYAIKSTGSLLLAFNLRGKVHGGPAIATGNSLYVATDNGLSLVGP